MRELNCLRCGTELYLLKTEKIQLGQTGWFWGDWPNLIAGALEVEIYGCRKCGKLELMLPGFPVEDAPEENLEIDELPPEAMQDIVGVSMDGVPQVRCPACRKKHDFDYPQCPRCGYQYE